MGAVVTDVEEIGEHVDVHLFSLRVPLYRRDRPVGHPFGVPTRSGRHWTGSRDFTVWDVDPCETGSGETRVVSLTTLRADGFRS